jgi:hypothetical protein
VQREKPESWPPKTGAKLQLLILRRSISPQSGRILMLIQLIVKNLGEMLSDRRFALV